jgi:hypothetical protein
MAPMQHSESKLGGQIPRLGAGRHIQSGELPYSARESVPRLNKKQYKMSQNSTQKFLKIIGKSVKFLTVNMLNLNLTHINLHKNKIQ